MESPFPSCRRRTGAPGPAGASPFVLATSTSRIQGLAGVGSRVPWTVDVLGLLAECRVARAAPCRARESRRAREAALDPVSVCHTSGDARGAQILDASRMHIVRDCASLRSEWASSATRAARQGARGGVAVPRRGKREPRGVRPPPPNCQCIVHMHIARRRAQSLQRARTQLAGLPVRRARHACRAGLRGGRRAAFSSPAAARFCLSCSENISAVLAVLRFVPVCGFRPTTVP